MMKFIIACLLAVTILGCSEVKNIELNVDSALMVKNGDEFEIKVKIFNSSPRPQELVAIDVSNKYLKGIAITESNPNFSESYHVPIDNTTSHSMNLKLPPNDTTKIILYCTAIMEGEFIGNIDFCINNELTFLTHSLRTVVK